MDYELIRSSRKSLALEVRRDGRVLVRAPRWMPAPLIRAFVESRRDWIEERQRRAAEEREKHAVVERLSEAELRRLKQQARPHITARLEHFAPRLGVDYGRIAIRSQRSRWGSCSGKGYLNFNCLLLLAPPEVLDYVVVHELCHRLEMNHSPRFWAQVRRILPDYQASRRWLRQNGEALLERLPEK